MGGIRARVGVESALAIAVASLGMAALRPIATEAATGLAVWVHTPPRSPMCLGDTAQIALEVTRNFVPAAGASVTMQSRGGSSTRTAGPEGGLVFEYTATREGQDQLTFTAELQRQTGHATLPVLVQHCAWSIHLLYLGTFPLPEGGWIFSERARTTTLHLEPDSSGMMEAFGTATFVASGLVSAPQVVCAFDNPLESSSQVHARAALEGQTLTVNLDFEPMDFGSPGAFRCFRGSEVLGGIDTSGVVAGRVDVMTPLGVGRFQVPAQGGTYVQRRSNGVFWLNAPGAGRAIVYVLREAGGQ